MKRLLSCITIMLPALIVCVGCSYQQVERDGPFTLIMLPDTQNYADVRLKENKQAGESNDLSRFFYSQTDWIKHSSEDLDIAMVAHVGDIVQTDYDREWEIADRAFGQIDDSVPYILSTGNHDMGFEWIGSGGKSRTAATRETKINRYFPPSRFQDKEWYGGCYDNSSENYYCTFRRAGMKFLVVSLEFVPRDEVLTWASEVVSTHPDHRCIVITHWYLKADGKRFTNNPYGVRGNNAEQMWDKFVSRHKNIFMVLCGHVLGESRIESIGLEGNTVYQILADYQGMDNGGNGYLRIFKFIPGKDIIEVKTYSPVLDKFITTGESQFTIQYNMN